MVESWVGYGGEHFVDLALNIGSYYWLFSTNGIFHFRALGRNPVKRQKKRIVP